MTNKEKAIYVLREYNLGNPLADILLETLHRATGLHLIEMLARLNRLADSEETQHDN